MNHWSLSFLLWLLSSSLSAAPAPQSCGGCLGGGGSATASSGAGLGMVKITLEVETGTCQWKMTEDPLLLECVPTQGCQTSIFREWSNLGPGSALEFCIEIDAEDYCLRTRPLVNATGTGSQPRLGPSLPCSADVTDQFTFEISSPSAGLEAAVTASCSQCLGDS